MRSKVLYFVYLLGAVASTLAVKVTLRQTNFKQENWHFGLMIHEGDNVSKGEVHEAVRDESIDSPTVGHMLYEGPRLRSNGKLNIVSLGKEHGKVTIDMPDASKDDVINAMKTFPPSRIPGNSESCGDFQNCLDFTKHTMDRLEADGKIASTDAGLQKFRKIYDEEAERVRDATDWNSRDKAEKARVAKAQAEQEAAQAEASGSGTKRQRSDTPPDATPDPDRPDVKRTATDSNNPGGSGSGSGSDEGERCTRDGGACAYRPKQAAGAGAERAKSIPVAGADRAKSVPVAAKGLPRSAGAANAKSPAARSGVSRGTARGSAGRTARAGANRATARGAGTQGGARSRAGRAGRAGRTGVNRATGRRAATRGGARNAAGQAGARGRAGASRGAATRGGARGRAGQAGAPRGAAGRASASRVTGRRTATRGGARSAAGRPGAKGRAGRPAGRGAAARGGARGRAGANRATGRNGAGQAGASRSAGTRGRARGRAVRAGAPRDVLQLEVEQGTLLADLERRGELEGELVEGLQLEVELEGGLARKGLLEGMLLAELEREVALVLHRVMLDELARIGQLAELEQEGMALLVELQQRAALERLEDLPPEQEQRDVLQTSGVRAQEERSSRLAQPGPEHHGDKLGLVQLVHVIGN
ncbi:hypothetical protein FA15DRAFT_707100 [Coprinopsis marcescibilis]|uniref:Uncharacterized protein n=1 Tax=Coprinopsis marcescibilis TaxID=230819 RepID=A0A5C3KMX8_COPMA|nr:hypothetical protein FA15DRAFT_707100 [Coprinopsis marcescibilis]